jgi:DNA-binding NarL/FixJ family response regulator
MLEFQNIMIPHPTINVLVVEDHTAFREGLAALINGTAGFACCGAWSSIEQALSCQASIRPDLALLDIDLPGMSGIEGISLLTGRWPSLYPLMLTVHDDDRRILNALCAGANGYLLKGTAPARLLECLKEASEGGAPMSPEVARRVVEVFRKRPPQKADYDLTPHELRILRLLVSGENYKTAAVKIGVTAHAVSFHVRRIYEKLHVHSRSDAVAKALRSGLFD